MEATMIAFANFVAGYEQLLRYVAETTICTLELIGIIIIIVGSIRAIVKIVRSIITGGDSKVMIALGRSLALALEFKMGAEIVKTVIIHDLTELAILAVVIALRGILAFLIYWEIKNEKKDEKEEALSAEKTEKSE